MGAKLTLRLLWQGHYQCLIRFLGGHIDAKADGRRETGRQGDLAATGSENGRGSQAAPVPGDEAYPGPVRWR